MQAGQEAFHDFTRDELEPAHLGEVLRAEQVDTCGRHKNEYIGRMRSLPILILVVGAAACSAPAVEQSGPVPAQRSLAAGAATITPADIKARISFLASDALRGRDTPSPGLETAAAYIAGEFKRIGLEPRGDNGGWMQRYPYTIRHLKGDGTRLTVITANQPTVYSFGTDVFAWGGTTQNVGGELAFVGTKVPDAEIGRAHV